VPAKRYRLSQVTIPDKEFTQVWLQISLQNSLKDGMLEIDSTLAENAIRPLAKGRKNNLFAGPNDAAKNIGMFYS